MGTNYFAIKKIPSLQEPIHIGKSSKGWLFHFEYQYNPDIPCIWNNYEEVKKWLLENTKSTKSKYIIMDEYENKISYDDFIQMIEDKQNNPENIDNPDNFTFSDNVNGYRFSKGYFR